jgi:putative salt-induced outer membrane protein YdiY
MVREDRSSEYLPVCAAKTLLLLETAAACARDRAVKARYGPVSVIGGTSVKALSNLFFALVVAVGAASSAQGQTSINDFSKGLEGAPKKADPNACAPAPKDPSLWDKTLQGGFSYSEGNSNVSAINVNSKLGRDFEREAWRFELDYNYGAASDGPNTPKEVTKNNFRAYQDYEHTLDTVFFVGENLSFTWDQIANVKYRVILSPAVGAHVIKDSDQTLSIEVGPSYVWEKLGDDTEDYPGARVANRWTYTLSQTASLFQGAEYVISLEDASNYLVNAELGVESALTATLDLFFSVRDFYINQPAADRRPNDVQTLVGVKVNL